MKRREAVGAMAMAALTLTTHGVPRRGCGASLQLP